MALSTFALRRVRKELREMIDEDFGKLELMRNSFDRLKGEVHGPPDTPYEGGRFVFRLKVPQDYPYKPPHVRFITRIWHPNFSPDSGEVCLNILAEKWSPSLTLRTVLLSLQYLLANPCPEDPLELVVGAQYEIKHQVFLETARWWTYRYAGGPSANNEFEEKVLTLQRRGIKESKAVLLLSENDWEIPEELSQ